MIAVPNVTAAAASPEKVSSPEMSAARTAPSESVAPNATPPSTCAIESTPTVRRWTRARSAAVSGSGDAAASVIGPGHASLAVLRSVPRPEISTSIVSPATNGPTPDGVPVRMTSPGSSVKAADAYAMMSATEWIMSVSGAR